jgi:hypothetical protein
MHQIDKVRGLRTIPMAGLRKHFVKVIRAELSSNSKS